MAVVVPFISTWDGKALKAAQVEMGRTASVMKRQGAALSTVGSSMTKLLTIPILAIGAAAMYAAADYGKASRVMQQQTGATGARLAEMNRSFDTVFKAVPQGAEDVGKAIATVQQRTGATGKTLDALSKQSLNLARVTGGELATQVENTQRAMANWNVATKDQGAAMDYLFAVSQHTGIAYDALAQGMQTFGPSMRAFNMSFETGAAMLGEFEKAGISVDATTKSLTFALKTMAKEGIKDPAAALPGLIERVKSAKTEGEAAAIAFKYFGRSGVYMLDAIRSGKVDLTALTEGMGKTTNAVNISADSTLSLSDRWKEFGHNLESELQPLGKTIVTMQKDLIPILTDAVHGLNGLSEGFDHLSGGWKKTIVYTGLLVAAMGPAVSIAANLMRGTADLYKAGQTLVIWLGKTTAAHTANAAAATADAEATAAAGTAAQTSVPLFAGFAAKLGLAGAAAWEFWHSYAVAKGWQDAAIANMNKELAAFKARQQAFRDDAQGQFAAKAASLGFTQTIQAQTGAARAQIAATHDATSAQNAQTRALDGTMVALESLKGLQRTSTDATISYRQALIAQHTATKGVTAAMKEHHRSAGLVKQAQNALKDGTFLQFLDKNKKLTDAEKDAILRAASAYQDTKDKANDAKKAMDKAAKAKTPPVNPIQRLADAWADAAAKAQRYASVAHSSMSGTHAGPAQNDSGGYVPRPLLTWVGEKRPEYIINPAEPNAFSLIASAARDAGMDLGGTAPAPRGGAVRGGTAHGVYIAAVHVNVTLPPGATEADGRRIGAAAANGFDARLAELGLAVKRR